MVEQIFKLPKVQEASGLSGSSIYRLASKGKFPKPIKLGQRSSGWLKSEIDQWLTERIEASRTDAEV